MRRTLTTLLLSLALLAPAHAETYKDPDGRFDVTLPEGWTSQKIDDRRVVTFGFSHTASETAPYDGICLGLFMDLPSTRSRTQDDINEMLEGQLTQDFWQKAMKSSDPNFSMKLDSNGSREQSGRKIYNIVYTATGKKGEGAPESVRGKTELHFVPGSMHFVMCMTKAEYFDAAGTGFSTIFASYEPHPNTLVSRNEHAPSVLTMFANANFSGTARVLSQDVASLVAVGLPATSASVTVDGIEPWQVCSGTNYSGQCQTIAVAEGRPLAIGSARRVANAQNLNGIAATAFRRAMQHPAVRAVMKR